MRLTRSFFDRPTLIVAQALLGTELVFGEHRGIITETEAYIGKDDPACHAARGQTPRNAPMFGPAGFSYVYFIYGMYHCLNFVTEAEGFPAAVLIRGLKLTTPPQKNLNGPGKLCRELGITREHTNLDLITHESFYVNETGLKPEFIATPRIGISQGKDLLWRFIVK